MDWWWLVPAVLMGIGDGLSKRPGETVASMLALLYCLVTYFVALILGILLTAFTIPPSSHFIQTVWGGLIPDIVSPISYFSERLSRPDAPIIWALGYIPAAIWSCVKAIWIIPVRGGNWQVWLTMGVATWISARLWIGLVRQWKNRTTSG